MNKQELIDYCNVLKESKNRFINCIDVDRIIDKIKQLDEPQPVKVPPFVADWYEKHKYALEFNIFDYVYRFEQQAENDFKDWFDDINTKAIQILVNMHQFGYEVEEEKRYIVRVKGVEEDNAFLNYYAPRNEWFMDSSYDMKDIRASHTRKELEDADFGWVFDCKGVEIEEVKD